MADISISVLVKTLAPLVKIASPFVKRFRNERKAGLEPFQVKSELLTEILNNTYSHICTESFDDKWWKDFTQKLIFSYISPDFLKNTNVQQWLAKQSNKQDLINLTVNRLINQNGYDVEIRKRLSASYSEITGENENKSFRPIIVIVAVLTAGYISTLDLSGISIIAYLQGDSSTRRKEMSDLTEQISKLSENIQNSKALNDNADKDSYIKKSINIIKKTRSYYGEENTKRIKLLAERVTNGDLASASMESSSEVIYWAARLLAFDDKYDIEVNNYLSWLNTNNPSINTAIIFALLKDSKKQSEEAIQIFSDIDSNDGRSSLFISIKRNKGDALAIEWYIEQKDNQDINFFTGIGWSNLALTYAALGRWEDASEILKGKNVLYEDWPDLAYTEGVINSALLLPEEYRVEALRFNLFHNFIQTNQSQELNVIREYADSCFEKAILLFNLIDIKRAEAASLWRSWLKLTSHNEEIVNEEKYKLREKMHDKKHAINLLMLADAFNIEYDAQELLSYIEKRKKLGDCLEYDVTTELVLVQKIYKPKELVNYIESEFERLNEHVEECILSYFLIKALVENTDYERARRILERDKEIHSPEEYLNLSVMIKASAGDDPLEELENLFSKRNSLLDLHNIIGYLKEAKDWKSLSPYVETLFDRERTRNNLQFLVHCYQKDNIHNQLNILECLNNNDDFVCDNHELISLKAWTLFYLGKYSDSQEINNKLLDERECLNDLYLDINLAIFNGDWDRFSYIVGREWENKENFDSQTLLRLATIAAETDTDSDRALELAKQAAVTEPDNPHVLLNSYMLAFQLGRDEDADPQWLSHAHQYSSDDGPVWNVNIKKIVEEIAPAHRERVSETERRLIDGSISISIAANVLNIPNTRILLEIPLLNAVESDGRLRTIIPIISGSHKYIKIHNSWTVGLDYTSIIVLGYLGMLNKVIDHVGKIIIAPATMTTLLSERRRARFHQPSVIEKAKQIRQYIDNKQIDIVELSINPPQWLKDEVGFELAELLHQCKQDNGFIVHHFPIYKIGSFMEEEASLQEYAHYILPIKSFLNLLFENQHIDLSVYKKSILYIEAHESGDICDTHEFDIRQPIYLDNLSITYLQGAGVMDILSNRNLELRIHHSTSDYLMSLITAGSKGEKNSLIIDTIRKILRDGIKSDKITILSMEKITDHDDGENDISDIEPTLNQYFSDIGPCDAISIDDRFYNKHPNIIDRKENLIPVVCSIDLILFLLSQEVINKEEWFEIIHKYRCGGYALILQVPEELEYRLSLIPNNEDILLHETVELRVLRQWLSKINSLFMINFDDEYNFIYMLQLSCILQIRKIWGDLDLDTKQAIKLTDWIWDNIMPRSSQWFEQKSCGDYSEKIINAEIDMISMLLKPMGIADDSRYKSYNNWVEYAVIKPFSQENYELIEKIANNVKNDIDEWSEESG